MFKSYKDLKVWQLGKTIAKDIYVICQSFPKEETYGLAAQLKRAAVSIPSNIAEGHARAGTKEFLHYISITRGSMAEIETQLELAVDFGLLSREHIDPILVKLDELGRMLRGLKQSLSSDS